MAVAKALVTSGLPSRRMVPALIRLRLGSELSREDRFAPVSYRPVTAVVLWRAREDWEAAVD